MVVVCEDIVEWTSYLIGRTSRNVLLKFVIIMSSTANGTTTGACLRCPMGQQESSGIFAESYFCRLRVG